MKSLTRATTLAFGLVCAAGASAAQDQRQATNLRDVTVYAVPGKYDTYVANLHTSYTLHALVGHTHRQYVQARRAAEASESARMRGLPSSHVAVAIDNSSGPGVARRILLIGPDGNTVAIVNVYCKRSMPSGAPRCNLAPQVMQAGNDGQRLASAQAPYPQVAQVSLRD
jgi:hypothetical protein